MKGFRQLRNVDVTTLTNTRSCNQRKWAFCGGKTAPAISVEGLRDHHPPSLLPVVYCHCERFGGRHRRRIHFCFSDAIHLSVKSCTLSASSRWLCEQSVPATNIFAATDTSQALCADNWGVLPRKTALRQFSHSGALPIACQSTSAAWRASSLLRELSSSQIAGAVSRPQHTLDHSKRPQSSLE